jgi:hypothetical protein
MSHRIQPAPVCNTQRMAEINAKLWMYNHESLHACSLSIGRGSILGKVLVLTFRAAGVGRPTPELEEFGAVGMEPMATFVNHTSAPHAFRQQLIVNSEIAPQSASPRFV